MMSAELAVAIATVAPSSHQSSPFQLPQHPRSPPPPPSSSSYSPPATPIVGTRVRKTVRSLQIGFLLTVNNAPALLQEVSDLLTVPLASLSCLEQGEALLRRRRQEFGAAKGIPALLSICHKFEDDARIQQTCLELVCCLVDPDYCGPDNPHRVIAADGIRIILVAMLKHMNVEQIQELGCEALALLAASSAAASSSGAGAPSQQPSQEENENPQNAIVATSGVEVIVTALQAHPTSAAVQAQACRALSHLAVGHARNCFHIGAAAGAIKAVVAAAAPPSQDDEMSGEQLLYAISAIRHLTATNDANRGAVAAAGGLPGILAALQRPHVDAELLENACQALWNLSINHKQNAHAMLVSHQALPILLKCMQQHEAVLGIQQAGCGVLAQLTELNHATTTAGTATTSANANSHNDDDGSVIHALLTAMRQFESSAVVQEQGCAALCNLAGRPENHVPLAREGGIGLIVSAMKKLLQDNNLPVQKNACRALQHLASHDDPNKISIAAAGGISALLSSMQRYPDHAALQGLAVRVLYSLARDNKRIQQQTLRTRTTTTMSSSNNHQPQDALETIDWAVQNNPNNVLLQNVGRKLLVILDPSRADPDD